MTSNCDSFSSYAIIGSGNGGKTAAVDLALKGATVNLFEFPEWSDSLDGIKETKTLVAKGKAINGTATLNMVTTDFEEAVHGVDVIMLCLQSGAIPRAAKEIVDLAKRNKSDLVTARSIIVLNPGSTGGSLIVKKAFHQWTSDVASHPLLVELGTLTYGTRATGNTVNCTVKAKRVKYATMPMHRMAEAFPLESHFPGLTRCTTSVLEAGLCNANPVIHPSITILNSAVMENEGSNRFFYADGVSPLVATMIKKLDSERLALLDALGTEGEKDTTMSRLQGYANQQDDDDYYSCYKEGDGFGEFRNPEFDAEHRIQDHRYYAEDVGLGLVLYIRLAKVLGVPTPMARATVEFCHQLTGVDYLEQGKDALDKLGIGNFDAAQLTKYLCSGEIA